MSGPTSNLFLVLAMSTKLRVPRLVTSLAVLVASNAQFTLPIVADSSFASLPAESIVSSQLSSWGVQIGPIDLKLGFGLPTTPLRTSNLLGLRSRGPKSQGSRAGERGLGGLTEANVDVDTGSGWGEADTVARGERGDTEVCSYVYSPCRADRQWFTYISIGSPPQSLPILPDTGSSDTFVFAPDCTTCFLDNHSSLDSSASSTFVTADGHFQVNYADGSGASGWIGRDVFTFGHDHTVSAVMAFGLATTSNGTNLRKSARSGVMGLGQESMATIPKGTTLFAALVKAGQIQDKVLSIRLEKGEQSKGVVYKEGTGSYVFGGIEDSYIRGGELGLHWIDTTSANYW